MKGPRALSDVDLEGTYAINKVVLSRRTIYRVPSIIIDERAYIDIDK